MRGFVIFLFIVVFFGMCFFGYRYAISKTLSTTPKHDVSDATLEWQKKSQEASDLQQRQRDLMRQRQDHLRDMQRR